MMVEVLACLYLLVIVIFFWRLPVGALLLLGIGIGYWIWRYRDKADAAAMLAAAVLGTPAEMICVSHGVWTYHAPGLLLGIPVWIPLIWASLFCLFRRITLSLLEISRWVWHEPNSTVRKILINALGAGILVYYLVLVAVVSRPILLVYSTVMLMGMLFWRRERDIVIFSVGGILGTIGEFICMQIGFWQYHFPYLQSFGLPVSLPMAWGLSAVMVGKLAEIWETESGEA